METHSTSPFGNTEFSVSPMTLLRNVSGSLQTHSKLHMSYINHCDSNYLRITNLSLLFSLLYFYLHSKKNNKECFLAGVLVLIIILSQLFWSNPIQHSTIHRIDAMVAKMGFVSFVVYILFFKKHPWWGCLCGIFIIFCISISFFFSHHFSSLEWCSENHLICHGMMHIFSYIGTFFAFY